MGCKHCNGMEPCEHCLGRTAIDNLRTDLAAALAQLAEKEAQVCAARELPVYVDEVITYSSDGVPFLADCTLDLVRDLNAANEELKAALTSSTPCPHAKEAERLREAMEWALKYIKSIPAGSIWYPHYEYFEAELRRRAGKDG